MQKGSLKATQCKIQTFTFVLCSRRDGGGSVFLKHAQCDKLTTTQALILHNGMGKVLAPKQSQDPIIIFKYFIIKVYNIG